MTDTLFAIPSARPPRRPPPTSSGHELRLPIPVAAVRQATMFSPPVPKSLRLVLPYPPSVNHYWRAVNGRQIISSEGRRYKAACAKVAAVRCPYECDVTLCLVFYRPRRAGDLDNSFKAALDALKGVVFNDDSQVKAIVAAQGDDKSNPRVEIIAVPFDRAAIMRVLEGVANAA